MARCSVTVSLDAVDNEGEMVGRPLRELAPALCLVAVIASGCATRRDAIPRALPPASPSVMAQAILVTALDLQGTPYRNGGETPEGFDCSGFTQYVFAQHGIDLPRRTSDQYEAGAPIPQDKLAAGDLVFFSTVATGASHVGVSTGDGRFVHAPSRRGRVRVEHLAAPYWTKRYVGARRLLAP